MNLPHPYHDLLRQRLQLARDEKLMFDEMLNRPGLSDAWRQRLIDWRHDAIEKLEEAQQLLNDFNQNPTAMRTDTS